MGSLARRRAARSHVDRLCIVGLLLTCLAFGEARAGEGAEPVEGRSRATLALTLEREVLAPGLLPGVVVQLLWVDPDHAWLLTAQPAMLVEVDLRSATTEVLAEAGEGPFDLDSMVNTLSMASQPLLHRPQRMTTALLRDPQDLVHHERACVAATQVDDVLAWLCPGEVQMRGTGEARTTVELHVTGLEVLRSGFTSFEGAPMFRETVEGTPERAFAAQYFTRLLPAGPRSLWRVVLGHHGFAQHIANGGRDARILWPGEGHRRASAVEASTDDTGRLHLLVGEDGSSWGRRVLRLGADGAAWPDWVGDRPWSSGVVDATGERWLAVEGESGALLSYRADVNPRRR